MLSILFFQFENYNKTPSVHHAGQAQEDPQQQTRRRERPQTQRLQGPRIRNHLPNPEAQAGARPTPQEQQELQINDRKKHSQQYVFAPEQVKDKLRQGKVVTDKSSARQLEGYQDELKNLAVNINLETKKNRVLQELIELTNREMLNNKKSSARSDTMPDLYSTQEKKMKKQEYDIQKILQMNNEEVAKINELKEQVSFSRRERVVYSNLFKKIEKEIKIYEEKFKEVLLQAHDLSYRRKVLLEEFNQKRKAAAMSLEKSSYNRHAEPELRRHLDSNQAGNNNNSSSFIGNVRHNSITLEPAPPAVNTNNPHNTNSKRKTETMAASSPTNNSNSHHSHSNGSLNGVGKRNPSWKTTTATQEIQHYELFFDAVKMKFGKSTIEQTIQFLEGVEGENESLMRDIYFVDDAMQLCNDELIRLSSSQAPKLSQNPTVVRADTEENEAGANAAVEMELIEMESTLRTEASSLKALCSLLNIQVGDTSRMDSSTIEEQFRLIEDRLVKLICLEKKLGDHHSIEGRSKRHWEENQSQIEALIDKLDKYHESEKILTRDVFYQEYSKEIGKIKRHKPKK